VQGTSWNSEFHQFKLNVTQFPTVFRWLELPSAAPVDKVPQVNGSAPAKLKVAEKKAAPKAPTGSRHPGLWSDEPTSSRSSFAGSDLTSSFTNGFDNGNFNSHGKASKSNKPSAKLCQFFQKVTYLMPLPLCSNMLTQSRAFVALVTSALSNTYLHLSSIQTISIHLRLRIQLRLHLRTRLKTAPRSPSTSPPARIRVTSRSTNTHNVLITTSAHPRRKNGPSTSPGSTSKSLAIPSTFSASVRHSLARTITKTSNPNRATSSSMCLNAARVLRRVTVGVRIASMGTFARRMGVRDKIRAAG
jgi:hypothetical protein